MMSRFADKVVRDWWPKRWFYLGQPAAIFAVALVLRVGYVLMMDDLYPLDPGDQMAYDRIAREWIAGGTFMPGSSYRPPGYPAFVALVYWVFGPHRVVVELVQAFLGAITALLTAKLAAGLFQRRVGSFAGWIVAVLPVLIHFTGQLMAETLFTALLMALLLVQARGAESRGPSMLVTGLLTAVGALLRPNVLLLPLALAAWWKVGCGWPMRKVVSSTGLCFAVVVLCILPWSLRNLKVHGTIVPISTNGGVNLWIGNNTNATGDWLKPADYWLPSGQTEAEVDRQYLHAALEHIVAHPGRTAFLAVRKFVIFWSPYPHPLDRVFFWGMAGFGLLGVAGTVRRRQSWFLLATLAYFTVVSCVFFANQRFHVPLLPVLGVYAGAGAEWLWVLLSRKLGK
ncbi:MAG: glycosyltransferase family 39 protein [candidate division KSB1 bacterium]|nr:glycosyltransferase family 39 protein [candidate division KSB1 bacterium]